MNESKQVDDDLTERNEGEITDYTRITTENDCEVDEKENEIEQRVKKKENTWTITKKKKK